MAVSEDRRRALRAAALVGLLRSVDGTGPDPSTVLAAGPVAAAVLIGDRAEVLIESGAPGVVAGALLWADRQGADRLRLFVDATTSGGAPEEAATYARRWASHFTLDTDVWFRDGATAHRLAVPSDPGGTGAVPSDPGGPGADDPTLRALLETAGLEVVEEHGVVTGELLGLEVARLVRWPTDLGGDGLVHVETGVGRFDRDATAAVRAGEGPEAALARVVEQVGSQRRPEDPTNPLALLARERWLRRSLLDDPQRIGMASLRACATTVARDGVRDSAPAAATGEAPDGGPVVVVCSVGADLAFVPVAADTRAVRSPGARLVLVVPERDLLPSTVRLAELVVDGAELLGVCAPWETGVRAPWETEDGGPP